MSHPKLYIYSHPHQPPNQRGKAQEPNALQYQRVSRMKRGRESDEAGRSLEAGSWVRVNIVQDRPITESRGLCPVFWTLTFQGTGSFTDPCKPDQSGTKKPDRGGDGDGSDITVHNCPGVVVATFIIVTCVTVFKTHVICSV